MRSPRGARPGLAALVAAALVVLTGCQGDDDPEVDDRFEGYCAVVRAEQRPLSEALGQGETTGLLAALPSFARLQKASPDDISEEWATVVDRVRALHDALDDADVDPATYDPKKPPSGLATADRDAIKAAADGLARPETAAALAGVEQQARDVCKTPLSQ